MLDEITRDIMKGLPQQLPARQDVLDCPCKLAQTVGFSLMLGFRIADLPSDGRISQLQLFENDILFRMMVALGVVLEIINDGLQNLIIW